METKIKGIICTLKSPVAVRLVEKFLNEIAKNYPKDFQKIRSKTTHIVRVPKKDMKNRILGQVVRNDGVREWAEFAKVSVRIDESIKDKEHLLVVVAHEFGHVCTTEFDMLRRCAPVEEFASEAAADWYAYKWGYGKISRKINVKHERDLLHNGCLPGGTCEENSIEYRLTRNFVYHTTIGNKTDTQIAKEKTLKYLAANKLDLTSFGKLR